jgi:cytochrome c553
MKTIATLSLVFVLAAPAVALAAGDAAAGKEVFLKKCASCHGQQGEGRDAIARSLNVKLKHLGSAEAQAKSDADVKKAISQGTGKMKGVADLDAKAVDDVLAFFRTLKAAK